MEIEFKNGAVYQYYNVNANLYEEFLSAPSKGQFFHAYIRYAVPFSRV
ncbi:KTSC domain-containing protein [Pseudomonas oryzihabitans]